MRPFYPALWSKVALRRHSARAWDVRFCRKRTLTPSDFGHDPAMSFDKRRLRRPHPPFAELVRRSPRLRYRASRAYRVRTLSMAWRKCDTRIAPCFTRETRCACRTFQSRAASVCDRNSPHFVDPLRSLFDLDDFCFHHAALWAPKHPFFEGRIVARSNLSDLHGEATSLARWKHSISAHFADNFVKHIGQIFRTTFSERLGLSCAGIQ
jgi:hypothetical protein